MRYESLSHGVNSDVRRLLITKTAQSLKSINMAVINPSIDQLGAFAKYARPRTPFFLFLSICFEVSYWPLLLIFVFGLASVIYVSEGAVDAFLKVILNPFLLLSLALVIAFGRWRKRFRVNAPRVLENETRMPILYLRSFLYETAEKSEIVPKERRTKLYEYENDDEVLAMALRSTGPLVAIGKPDDKIPPLGALRLYFADEEWQEKVEMLMAISQLVIIQSGNTAGTNWEIQRARELLPPEKIIFSFLSWQELGAGERQSEYELFSRQIKRAYGCDLPETIGRAYFLYFDKEWKPQLIGLTGWKAGFFWSCSRQHILWRFLFVALRGGPLIFFPIRTLLTNLLRRLPTPPIFREYSVPAVREALRPVVKATGVRLPIWRTIVFMVLAIAAGVLIFVEFYGWPLIVVLALASGSLVAEFLPSSADTSPQALSLFAPDTPNAEGTKDKLTTHEIKFRKCLDCGLGNWHDAIVCERCGRTLERI